MSTRCCCVATATPSCAAASCCAFKPRRSEEHTSELQSPCNLVCRLLLEKKKFHSLCYLCEVEVAPLDRISLHASYQNYSEPDRRTTDSTILRRLLRHRFAQLRREGRGRT